MRFQRIEPSASGVSGLAGSDGNRETTKFSADSGNGIDKYLNFGIATSFATRINLWEPQTKGMWMAQLREGESINK